MKLKMGIYSKNAIKIIQKLYLKLDKEKTFFIFYISGLKKPPDTKNRIKAQPILLKRKTKLYMKKKRKGGWRTLKFV